MPRKKKSFFQRLTGAVHMDEEPEFDLEDQQDSIFPQEGSEEEESEENIQAEPEEAQLTVDVYQTPTELVIQTIVAGVRPEDIDISITRETVTIRGSRPADATVQDHDYYHQELFWGPFTRTIMLPQEVEPDKAAATEKNGLLTVKIPKIDKHKEKRLRVKSGS
jgi:HSP20 family molecular chaperone IbpA